eukprot:COSAG06_NODE_289_length_18231_cov_20.202515_13_plen_350_part_00
MTGASSQVPEFAHSLCEQTGIRVVLMDSRGCGQTRCDYPTIATQYAQAQMATDLIAVANALGVKRFSVGGQSYGTRVSIYTAAMAKGRVDKVVLVVPPPITAPWGPSGADAPTTNEELMATFEQMREAAAPSNPTQPTHGDLLKQAPVWKRACTARKGLPDELAVREMGRAASNSLNPGFDTYKLQVRILSSHPHSHQAYTYISRLSRIDIRGLCAEEINRPSGCAHPALIFVRAARGEPAAGGPGCTGFPADGVAACGPARGNAGASRPRWRRWYEVEYTNPKNSTICSPSILLDCAAGRDSRCSSDYCVRALQMSCAAGLTWSFLEREQQKGTASAITSSSTICWPE